MDQTKNIPVLDLQSVLHNLQSKKNPFWTQYHAFFSSWLGGITKDPSLMVLPMDDHMVHRGDGVFEAMKAVDRKVFLLKEHLQRLSTSSQSIGISLPYSISEIQDIILQTLKVADQPNALIRLFVSRGPGGFSPNPYDSIGSQLYIAITDLRSPKAELYDKGVRVGRSSVAVKEAWMAQTKSCNYLPNVMMKKESVDRKLDFTISFDHQNFVAESSTENIAMVDEKGILTHPPFENILRGTTMVRAFQLAKEAGLPTAIRTFTEQEILKAQEIFMIGTTLDVLPVTEFDGKKISGGEAGPVARRLLSLVREDFKKGVSF
jgi:branched-chain amino acid aminotransferase